MNLSRRSLLCNASMVGLATSGWTTSAIGGGSVGGSAGAVEAGARVLAAVPIENVVVEDAFWTPKREVWQNVTIPDCLAKFEADRGGAFNNFDKVRDGCCGHHAGDPWMDGLVYEMIRAACDFLTVKPDPILTRRVEGYAHRIAAAAAVRPDGYLNTYTQLVEPGHEWGDHGGLLVWQHDIYNLGALIDAGIHLYRATGSTTLLVPAVRIANTMEGMMGPPPKRSFVPAHPLPEEALIRLHELFIEQPAAAKRLPLRVSAAAYRRLAEFWIESRGRNTGTPDWNKGRPAAERFVREGRQGAGRPSWGSYAQDHAPVFEQRTIEGHAVRATLLCAGVSAAARVNGDPRYRDAAERLWESMVLRRMHVTGGVGAFADEEKFGPDFELPNGAYLETCAAVGAGFFHRNMNLLFRHARYVDELERVLYNGALSGVSLKGDTYLYRNPLEGDPLRARWTWNDVPCCPPMFLKLMGAMPGYIYAADADGVYVNLFVGSRATITTRYGDVVLRQSTRYPWNGVVDVSIEHAPRRPLAVMIRVPAWCDGATLAINGVPVPSPERVNGYARLFRAWAPGDTVRLDMPLPVRQVRANPRVKNNRGRAALMRGPVVYCVETADADDLTAIALSDTTFVPRSTSEFGGAVVLDGIARIATASTGGPLYQSAPFVDNRRTAFTAIPYFANLNRGAVNMQVWLPLEL